MADRQKTPSQRNRLPRPRLPYPKSGINAPYKSFSVSHALCQDNINCYQYVSEANFWL
ncbi:hypothetical protein [Siccibacter turicensis]|uniref:hypothetical protein n=1 Tax=Siccibacter turicensis TaxID=357233 RepID=UPI0012DF98DA|nr:hypothetical protein [Siccibacter turicensis]